MKAPGILSMAMLFLAAGCANPDFYWYHPDRTIDQAKADFCECQEKARQEATEVVAGQHFERLAPPADSSDPPRPLREQSRPAGDPRKTREAWRARYEQSALAGGMRGRGYVKLRPDRVPRSLHTRTFPKGAVAGR